mmetsp:Transcript_11475/g.23345  ORF Transcript_11475/g.23345 Transcript_11475/m.23345 type:complete len:100 (+) Transcript_11475:816-1115(+)
MILGRIRLREYQAAEDGQKVREQQTSLESESLMSRQVWSAFLVRDSYCSLDKNESSQYCFFLRLEWRPRFRPRPFNMELYFRMVTILLVMVAWVIQTGW